MTPSKPLLVSNEFLYNGEPQTLYLKSNGIEMWHRGFHFSRDFIFMKSIAGAVIDSRKGRACMIVHVYINRIATCLDSIPGLAYQPVYFDIVEHGVESATGFCNAICRVARNCVQNCTDDILKTPCPVARLFVFVNPRAGESCFLFHSRLYLHLLLTSSCAACY